MNIIQGDLIKLALKGNFDVIGHGCNCFNTMGAGIAPQIAKAFPDAYKADQLSEIGDYNKLGNYTIGCHEILPGEVIAVLNLYTQYYYRRPSPKSSIPLDYDALRLCLRKVNMEFNGYHIGLPWIGCGLAGGNQERVQNIIEEELTHMVVTIVEYKP